METQTYVAELAKRLIALDEEAYLEFAELFGPQLLRYFKRHGLEHFEAEDLAATCVTDIAIKVNKYRIEEGAFNSWVFALAHNALADRFKTRKRQSDAIQGMEQTAMEDLLWDTDIAIEVSAALAELPEIDRVLVGRRLLGSEHSYRELAAELGLTEGAARVRHLRALRRLEERLVQMPGIQARIQRNAGRGERRVRERSSRKSA